MRLKQDDPIPVRWFVCGIVEEGCVPHEEYYFFLLRLPSYQFMQGYGRNLKWHQLSLWFHGKDGFDFQWLPCPT
jgi:hypothetical protein